MQSLSMKESISYNTRQTGSVVFGGFIQTTTIFCYPLRQARGQKIQEPILTRIPVGIVHKNGKVITLFLLNFQSISQEKDWGCFLIYLLLMVSENLILFYYLNSYFVTSFDSPNIHRYIALLHPCTVILSIGQVFVVTDIKRDIQYVI